MNLLYEQLLVWLCYWGDLIDGLIGIITFGFVRLTLGLKCATILAIYRSKYRSEQ
jgi:hypothetical protein